MYSAGKKALSLIEVVIVVIVLVILAAFTLPTINILQEDAKRSELKASLKTLRGSIAAWKAKSASGGAVRFPTPEELVNLAVPSGIPANPYNKSNKVAVGTGEIQVNSAGWVYDPQTGEIYSAAAETQGAGF